jgi:hypothetical protein
LQIKAFNIARLIAPQQNRPMDLADFNFSSREWIALREWAEQELSDARSKNDSTECTELETAALRGEIRFAKRFLSLPESVSNSGTWPSE